jgi:hypothetical protein
MEVRLRKDGMKEKVKLACLKELHAECFWLIQNSSSRESLKAGCIECRKKYQGIVEGDLKVSVEPKKPRATRGYLLARVIFLERQNALLEREVEELKEGKHGV